MSKTTIENVKEVVNALSEDFRILNGIPDLSFVDEPNIKVKANAPNRNLILMLADFQDSGDDVLVAKKGLAFSIAKKLKITDNPNDFFEDF
jgi:hypothetical protein